MGVGDKQVSKNCLKKLKFDGLSVVELLEKQLGNISLFLSSVKINLSKLFSWSSLFNFLHTHFSLQHKREHFYTHINTHTYTHTYTHLYTHSNTHAYTHAYTHTHRHTQTRTHTHYLSLYFRFHKARTVALCFDSYNGFFSSNGIYSFEQCYK